MDKPANPRRNPRSGSLSGNLAATVEFLIHDGHVAEGVWNYTPKQAEAFVKLARQRQKREFSLAAIAARGDAKKTLDDWDK